MIPTETDCAMAEDLDSIMELNHSEDVQRRIKRNPICISLANLFALLTFLMAWLITRLEGEAEVGSMVFFVFGILPLQVTSSILLIVALLRCERPWWAYCTAMGPLLAYAIWVAH